MTARELGTLLLALPEDRIDLEVYGTANWRVVTRVDSELLVFTGPDVGRYVEIG